MAWLKTKNDDLYNPTYTDILRVTCVSEFTRGRLQDLVALISGRDFETKQFKQQVVDDTFAHLARGISRFSNETNFKNFLITIKSAGFEDASLIGSQNVLNFAYALYLTLNDMNYKRSDIECAVRRWFVICLLTNRYSGSFESAMDTDIRQIRQHGIFEYIAEVCEANLSDAFWNASLPLALDTASTQNPQFRVFLAAQTKLNDTGFLSSDITVRQLITLKGDLHHIFPKEYLIRNGLQRGLYNQVANYAVTESGINIAIGNRPPQEYFQQLDEQCNGGPKLYGNITSHHELDRNLAMHCIPEGMKNISIANYSEFLGKRRSLIAQRIRTYFEGL